nr:macro domain-containing protein [Anaerobutyricum hallii]
MLFSIIIIIIIFLIFWILCAFWFERQKWIEVFEGNNGCHIYVQYGDIFSPNEVRSPNQRRNVIIPVNRCFDTIIDDDLVSSRTLHGIAFRKLYSSGKYNEDSLNTALYTDLNIRQRLVPEDISNNEKRRGNLKRYSLGTVAEIVGESDCTYFFIALSTFDYNLSAHATQEEYVLTMQRMIEYCYSRSQGFPVVMPLIGAGQSRIGNNEREILEYIIGLFKMNKDLIMSDIHIVVRNSGKDTISITGL